MRCLSCSRSCCCCRSCCMDERLLMASFSRLWLWLGGRANRDGRAPGIGSGPVRFSPLPDGDGSSGCDGPDPLVPGTAFALAFAWPLALLLLSPAFSMDARQTGHVLCSLSHRVTHSSWNQCLQGRNAARSPTFMSSMQMVHSVVESPSNMEASTGRRSRLERASFDAGGAALDCGCASMRFVMIWSSASWE